MDSVGKICVSFLQRIVYMGAIKDVGKDCSSDGKENSKDSGRDILVDQCQSSENPQENGELFVF